MRGLQPKGRYALPVNTARTYGSCLRKVHPYIRAVYSGDRYAPSIHLK